MGDTFPLKFCEKYQASVMMQLSGTSWNQEAIRWLGSKRILEAFIDSLQDWSSDPSRDKAFYSGGQGGLESIFAAAEALVALSIT